MIYTFPADKYSGGRGPLFTTDRDWVARSLRTDYRLITRNGWTEQPG